MKHDQKVLLIMSVMQNLIELLVIGLTKMMSETELVNPSLEIIVLRLAKTENLMETAVVIELMMTEISVMYQR